MYKLFRRISSTFKERFDWTRENGEEDATSSSAKQVGSKRRMSDDGDDDVPNRSLSKRSRGAYDEDHLDASELGEVRRGDENENEAEESTQSQEETRPREETEDVRQVRKGVKEVDLEDDKGKGKELVEDGSSSFADGDEPEYNADERDGVPPLDETKTVETGEAKKVADNEPAADTDDVPESSKEDDRAVHASEDVDAPGELDVPSETEAVSDAPAPADTTTIASTEATEHSLTSAPATNASGNAPATLPPKDIVYEPETISEPLPAIAASEAPVKVQG